MMLALYFASFLASATTPGLEVLQPEDIPPTAAEDGNGRKAAFPALLQGRASILVVGFSKGSREANNFWTDRLDRDLAAAGKDPVVQVAHLQSIPGFMRGLLLGSIKGGVAPSRRDRFWMLFEDQDTWKKRMGFGPSDEAYIAVVDSRGRVVWRIHGSAEEAAYAAAKAPLLAALAAAN